MNANRWMTYVFLYVLPALVALVVPHTLAAPLLRQGAGANAAAIQPVVDQFRADRGGSNNGVGGTFATGRREINWDGVPDASAAPNFLAPDFFNTTSPRGLVLNTIEMNGSSLNDFMVSADSTNPTGTAVRFANLDPSYSTIFETFSPQRLMTARGTHMTEVTFFVPGTKIPATVSGFGCVFTDVDVSTGPRAGLIRTYAPDGSQLAAFTAFAANSGLSFAGVTFTAGERIARVIIQAGNAALASAITDSAATDVIAMDDFIYGEPQPLQLTAANGGKIEVGIPLKFLSITAAGAFVNAPLQCSPHHVYKLFRSTDLMNWTPAIVTGAPAGNTNQFNPRITWTAGALSASLQISKEGFSSLSYRAVDETNSEAAMIQFPGP
jgi:hypothetical protein